MTRIDITDPVHREIARKGLEAEANRWDEDVRTEHGDNIRRALLSAANEYLEESQ